MCIRDRDKIGRDVFARVLYGGRMSIAIGFGSALGCAFIGVLLGCYSGYRGGWFDSLMVRISEVFMSIPQLILVMMLVAICLLYTSPEIKREDAACKQVHPLRLIFKVFINLSYPRLLS